MKNYIFNIKQIKLCINLVRFLINLVMENNDILNSNIGPDQFNPNNIPPHFRWWLMQNIAQNILQQQGHIQNNTFDENIYLLLFGMVTLTFILYIMREEEGKNEENIGDNIE